MMLPLHLVLAIAWMALTGDFTPGGFLIGLALGYIAIGIGVRPATKVRYFVRVYLVIRFVLFFLWEFVNASLRVAFDIVTPQNYMRPAVIAVPLDAETDSQITLLANLITLTPGSLTLEVSADRKFLYIHTMYVRDIEQMREDIKDGLERRVREVLS